MIGMDNGRSGKLSITSVMLCVDTINSSGSSDLLSAMMFGSLGPS